MMNLRRIFIFILTIIVLLIPLSSCRPEPVAPEDAEVIILAPSADSVLANGSVTVRTFITNFKLADTNKKVNQLGEGHLIFYLDSPPPMVTGEPALTAEGTYFISSNKSYTWEGVSPGQHSFWVQLVNNDNTVLEPPAIVKVPVTVTKD